MVIFSHSYVLGGYGGPPFLPIEPSVGELGVQGFFAISGFLVTYSFIRSPSLLIYLWKRFLRILPGFWSCLLLTACVLSPIIYFFEHKGFEGLTISNNPFIKYIGSNFLLFIKQQNISGLFLNNPCKEILNGSLWTLFPEFLCYLSVPILSSMLLKKYKGSLLIFFCLLVLVNSVEGKTLGYFLPSPIVDRDRSLFEFQKMFSYFLGGAVLFVYQKSIPFNNKLFITSLLLLFITIAMRIYVFVGPFLFAYVIIGLAIKLPFSSFDKYGDYSYGLYIYAFPIQQTIYFLKPKIYNPIYFFFVSLLCIFPFAWLSWHLIEKPSLSLKKRLVNLLSYLKQSK